uniref:UBX domain-containing protein n=1 Tax=Canis lupus familiaris TaxID=9615 RepID=A0A8C0TUK6_CANLF
MRDLHFDRSCRTRRRALWSCRKRRENGHRRPGLLVQPARPARGAETPHLRGRPASAAPQGAAGRQPARKALPERPGARVRLRRRGGGAGGGAWGRPVRLRGRRGEVGEGGPCVSVLLFGGGGGGGKMAAHGGSAASSALKGLIQQFTAITGASESVGKHMLEACNNNLEMAVTMFLDGGGIAEEPSTSSASVSTVRPHTEEEVRAPIPQKQEILVEPEPLFGAPKRRRPARSIFDGFRDFQTETIRQEQELRNGGAIDKKLTTLADLFRPPIDLMHKGSFETVYHDSEEGQRYIQFYKLGDFPYVSILDPRTGQKLVEWHQLDVSSFLDQVTGFLGEHGQLDGLSSSPPKKCARSESLIDASEDSQLEAAIRASLQETHFDSTQTKQDSRSDEESESELFSGSEEFISVCGSDEEEEIENLAKSRKSPHKDLGHRKEENRRPLTEPPARTEPGTATNHQGLPPVDSEILEMSPEKSDGIVEGIDVNGPKAQLMLRYPDGKREQITLPEQAKLLALVKHVQSKGYPNERFELLTNFPRRKLSHLDYDITLQEAGLCPQETVFVQERN